MDIYYLVIKSSISLYSKKDKFSLEDKQYIKDLEKSLFSLWSALSLIVKNTISSDLEPVIDDKHCGYVAINSNKTKIYVPFFFAEFFPKDGLLLDILELVSKIKVFENGVCCISGSICQSANEISVSDLDFCEYVSQDEHCDINKIVNKYNNIYKDAICYEINIDSLKLERENNFSTSTLNNEVFKDSSRRKFNFIANVQNIGTIEATKLLLMIDPEKSNEGESLKSFSFQEAPISAIPRNLCSPLELGRYLVWLHNQIKELTDNKNGIKATKRALSATRILLLNDQTDELHSLLAEDDANNLEVLKSRCELYSKISKNTDPGIIEYIKPLESTINSFRKNTTTNSYAILTDNECLKLDKFNDKAVPILNRIEKELSQYIY